LDHQVSKVDKVLLELKVHRVFKAHKVHKELLDHKDLQV
jgi:hypothetical protein